MRGVCTLVLYHNSLPIAVVKKMFEFVSDLSNKRNTVARAVLDFNQLPEIQKQDNYTVYNHLHRLNKIDCIHKETQYSECKRHS